MPFPRFLARFNRVATNRVTASIARWVPFFVIVHHAGRASGQPYATPVSAFRSGNTVTFALTYGLDTDWVKNVLAAGRCDLEMSNRTITLADPRIIRDPARRVVPAFVRPILAILRADHFLQATIQAEHGAEA